jgi:hypothetical protein
MKSAVPAALFSCIWLLAARLLRNYLKIYVNSLAKEGLPNGHLDTCISGPGYHAIFNLGADDLVGRHVNLRRMRRCFAMRIRCRPHVAGLSTTLRLWLRAFHRV